MPRVGFQPTTPVFERVKIVHALVRAATVIGDQSYGIDRNEKMINWLGNNWEWSDRGQFEGIMTESIDWGNHTEESGYMVTPPPPE
jgi:hypothetical protein